MRYTPVLAVFSLGMTAVSAQPRWCVFCKADVAGPHAYGPVVLGSTQRVTEATRNNLHFAYAPGPANAGTDASKAGKTPNGKRN
jgi:hypothetical protein